MVAKSASHNKIQKLNRALKQAVLCWFSSSQTLLSTENHTPHITESVYSGLSPEPSRTGTPTNNGFHHGFNLVRNRLHPSAVGMTWITKGTTRALLIILGHFASRPLDLTCKDPDIFVWAIKHGFQNRGNHSVSWYMPKNRILPLGFGTSWCDLGMDQNQTTRGPQMLVYVSIYQALSGYLESP